MRELKRGLLALAVACAAGRRSAGPETDPNAAFANELIVVPLQGRSISALVTHQPGAMKFTHAVALFPGSPGQARLAADGGEIKFGDLRGNFLVRARRW